MAGLTIDRKREFQLIRWAIAAVLVIIVVAVAFYGYDYYVNGNKPPLISLPTANTSVDETPISQNQVNNYKVPATHPRYISVPSIGINKVRVQSIGLTRQNILAMPTNISDTGWYSDSSTPGQGYGQVIIDGYNQGISKNGIFQHIDLLQSGNKIIVQRGDNKQITYTVRKEVTMSLSAFSASGMQQLAQPADNATEGLGLVTEAGKWIPRDKVFTQRTLVWAIIDK